ncbi:hypothetical protein H4R34_000459 [Dimargaris verticillata]|uniref:Fungal lipase-type domain-containing protein n=1 Tax=Dimargaris verticillata TaxID=2761393 RepID=A0A9W8B684_9FUNG|nr:hypothetical protein H4R34_000459 [Dimargaris verticillata]
MHFLSLLAALGAVALALPYASAARKYTVKNVTDDQVDDLKVYANLAGAAYSDLTSWDCSHCDEVQNSTLVQFFSKNDNVTVGYIAVNNDIESVTLAFRGTTEAKQWVQDFKFSKVDFPDDTDGSQVHKGFLETYQEVADDVYEQATEQLDQHPNHTLTIVGHSLGGASVAAVDFVSRNESLASVMKVVTFGKPRVGNLDYVKHYNGMKVNTTRVVNKNDLIPHVPTSYMNFHHEGSEVWILSNSTANATVSCPQTNNRSNPDCSYSVKTRDLNQTQHDWYWDIYM